MKVLPCDVARQAREGETPKVLTLRTALRKKTAGSHCVQSVCLVESSR